MEPHGLGGIEKVNIQSGREAAVNAVGR